MMNQQVDDYRELRSRLPQVDSSAVSGMIIAASIERAGNRIVESIYNLELVIRTKKPEGL